MHDYWLGSYGWIWMIVNAVFWLALIAGVVWFITWLTRRRGSVQQGDYSQGMPSPAVPQTAKEIAQMRYARGEITREQYQQLIEDLSR